MPPQKAALPQRPLTAIEMAMMEELGSSRIATLPMDDGVSSHDAGLLVSHNIPRPQGAFSKRWEAAIAAGAFDDDDAMQVAGLDSIANGQLARMHRADRLDGLRDTARYDDQRLRRGRNGQVDPRAHFHRGQRGPNMTGRSLQGDGPFQVRGNLSNSRYTPAPPRVDQQLENISSSPRAHKAHHGSAPPGLGGRPGNVRVLSIARGARPLRPSQPQPAANSQVPVQTATDRAQKSGPQDRQQRPILLQDGASIVFQTLAEFASPIFMDKNATYPGIVYLVAGNGPSDDRIIFQIDDERLEDVKIPSTELGTLLTQSREVIVQFRPVTGPQTWYVVKFSQEDNMIALVKALRGFLSRPNQTQRVPSTAPETGQGTTGANESATVDAASQHTITDATVDRSSAAPAIESHVDGARSTVSLSSSAIVNLSQTAQSTEPPASDQPHAAKIVAASSQQQDAAIAVPDRLIEVMATSLISVTNFLRESGHVEMASHGALPRLIRGTAATMLQHMHPDFIKLNQQQQAAYIDQHCSQRVFDAFKRQSRKQNVQIQPAQTVKTTTSHERSSQEVQASMPSKPRAVIYTGEELMRLRSTARTPPHWLLELGFLKEATRFSRQQTRMPGLDWDDAHNAPNTDYNSQILKVTEWLHSERASESSPSSFPQRMDELIGLFVMNATSDAEVHEIFAEQDQTKIVAVLKWGKMNRVVQFNTTEDRDGALQRIADEFKTRSRGDRSTPLVQIFQSRQKNGTCSTIHRAPDTGSFGGGHQKCLSIHTPQVGVNETVIPTRDANMDNDMAVSGHSINDDGGGLGANDNSAVSQTSSDILEIESENPSSSATDDQTGLNASMFNTDGIDLLGETAGLWTGVLAKNKSYTDDSVSFI